MSKYEAFFPGETILHEAEGYWIKSVFNVKQGTTVLTDKRIAFIEKKMIITAGAGGVAGLLAVKAADAALGISKPKLKADIEIEQIKTWSQPRKIDILVENTIGEKYKFRCVDYAVWDEELKKLKA